MPALATYFTADTHFGHGGALGFYRRPYASVGEMDAAMVANWRAVVGANDDVWHLGDFAIGKRVDAAALLAALPGRKHLVAGNNDPATPAAGWSSVQAYVELEVAGRLVVLCHYPFRTWRDSGRGAVNLHGHSHGRLKPLPRQYDVGVDARSFRPVTLEQIVAKR